MVKYPSHLLNLITLIKKLPGVGSKTAERYAFQLLQWPDQHLLHLSELLHNLKQKVQQCPCCHCLMEKENCHFCLSSSRDSTTLCIISSPKDVYALEETHTYKGLYHVIEGLLSPLDGRTPDHINVDKLLFHIESRQVQEVIVALDSTIEGDATSLYLKEILNKKGLRVSRLAFGLPMGSPLEYVDGGTLSRAFTGRQNF
jgi:recombination protein RecR